MSLLTIDTSDNKKLIIKIDNKTKTVGIEKGLKFIKSEKCLPLIDSFLKELKLSIKDIDKIYVNTGPGSFTGLRVGVSIANALGNLLRVPVNDKKIGELVFPVYN